MATLERPIADLHLEIYAPAGGFILGVSVMGDHLGGDAFRLGRNKFGDRFSDVSTSTQWVDYIDDSTDITYNRGGTSAGVGNDIEVGILTSTLKEAGNPLTDFSIRSGRAVRVRYQNEILFSGSLMGSAGRYVRNKTTFTKYFTLKMADDVKKLSALKAYGAGGLTELYETFEQRISRLLDTYEGAVELPTGNNYPQYRLCATVYSASLTSHLDLACNSVGASWYIDKLGQLRFIINSTDYITAVFSDGTHSEGVVNPLEYYKLNIEYDIKNHINYLELDNKGLIENPAVPGEAIADETKTLYGDITNIASNGYVAGSLPVSLYTEGAYSDSLANRAAEILAVTATPKPTITKLYFNMQENFLATQLETLHLIEVWHESIKYTLRISGISANIKPQEYLLELELEKGN